MSNRERAVKAARARPGAELAARAIEQRRERVVMASPVADVAQVEEQPLRKAEVVGSSPAIGSKLGNVLRADEIGRPKCMMHRKREKGCGWCEA